MQLFSKLTRSGAEQCGAGADNSGFPVRHVNKRRKVRPFLRFESARVTRMILCGHTC